MKVYVYTISLNEEQNAVEFAGNMREADGIFVLDTGSSDDTVRLLRESGCVVARKRYQNFRFDKARNDALKLVPDEEAICVCPDLDERFEPGWRTKLERAWTPNAERARYRYIWSVNADGSDGVTFIADKIHARHGFTWRHPVHETLCRAKPRAGEAGVSPDTPVVAVDTDVVLRHFPDSQKSRGQYLPLLELACKESPLDDRSAHYLAREYMFHRRHADAVREFKRHLSLKTATWADERCASYRFIARCVTALGQAGAEGYLLHAVAEAPHLREPLFELAELYYNKKEWYAAMHFLQKAVSLPRHESYITDPKCYSALPYDYLSMTAYYLKDYALAAEYAKKALTFGEDQRISGNLQLFLGKTHKEPKMTE